MIKVSLLLVLYLGLATQIGLRRAAWFFWPIFLTMIPNDHVYLPIWGGYRFSTDMLMATIALPGLLLSSGNGGWRLRFADLLAIGLVGCNIISYYNNNPFTPYAPIMFVFTGLSSYFLGRLYLRDTEDVYPMLQCHSVAITLIAGAAVVESLTHYSFIYRIFGLNLNEVARYGLMRARLGMSHPLGLVAVQTMLMGPCFEAARWGREGMGPRWWRRMPLIAMGGVMASVSRASVQCIMLVLIGGVFIKRPTFRIPIVVATLAIMAIAYINQEALLELLDRYENSGGGVVGKVLIDGQEQVYSSARHRFLLYDVYRDKMTQAGAFGFDRKWVGTVPAHLAVFNSVDHCYIMQRLMRGWVGISLLDLLLVITIIGGARFAIRNSARVLSELAAGLAITTLALVAYFFTTYAFPETWRALLWAAGLAASLPSLGLGPCYNLEDEDDDGYDDDEDYDEDPDAHPDEEAIDTPL